MKLEMGILSPSSYFSASNWLLEETKSAKWTPAENKMFENALALHDKDTPDRWHKVAEMIPGKTVGDVVKQYKELEADVGKIEAGLVPIPGYGTSPFTLEWVNRHGYDVGFKQTYGIGGKKSSSTRPADHERKKGVPLKTAYAHPLSKELLIHILKRRGGSSFISAFTPNPN